VGEGTGSRGGGTVNLASEEEALTVGGAGSRCGVNCKVGKGTIAEEEINDRGELDGCANGELEGFVTGDETGMSTVCDVKPVRNR